MLRFILTSVILLGFTFALSGYVSARPAQTETTAKVQHEGTFTKNRYTIHGQWSLEASPEQTRIIFQQDFKTKNGPDLKVFLSPRAVSDLESKSALKDAVKIGVLKSNRGEQTYVIPDDIDLSNYKSVIVHCEAFSVLWGGFDIPE